jgi:hypothetical protein
MVVREDKLDVNCFRLDVFLDCGRTFIVHYVQCQMVAAGFQYGDDFFECLYHGSIGARWHGPDNHCIKVVDVGNKHILHTFDGADREGAGDVGIHGACYGIGERSKAEHILHSTDFLGGNMRSTLARVAIMSNCMLHVEAVLAWCCCMCPLLVAVEHCRWFLINVVVRPGMVASSSLRSSAQRIVDADREHMIWWM